MQRGWEEEECPGNSGDFTQVMHGFVCNIKQSRRLEVNYHTMSHRMTCHWQWRVCYGFTQVDLDALSVQDPSLDYYCCALNKLLSFQLDSFLFGSLWTKTDLFSFKLELARL